MPTISIIQDTNLKSFNTGHSEKYAEHDGLSLLNGEQLNFEHGRRNVRVKLK